MQYPPSIPAPLMEAWNVSLGRAEFPAQVDAYMTWLDVVRTHSIVWCGWPMGETQYPSGSPLYMSLRLPPYCQGVLWGFHGVGQGTVYCEAKTDPSPGGPYDTALEIDVPHSLQAADMAAGLYGVDWTLSDAWRDDDPGEDGLPRALSVVPTTIGKPHTEQLDIWITDAASGDAVEVVALGFWPLPRLAVDPLY